MNLREKPSGIWVVDFTDDHGKRQRVSTETRDKVEARVRAKRILMGLSAVPEAIPFSGSTAASPQPPRKPSGFTMSDLFRKCELTIWHPREAKSQATIKSNLKVLEGLVGDVLVTDMTAGRLETLSQTLFDKGYAAGTVKRKMDMVGKSLTMATIWEDETTKRPYLLGKPKMPTISSRNRRERYLSDVEERAVFETIDKRMVSEPTRDWRRFRALMRFLLDTAARLGEALGVEEDDIEVRTIGDRELTFVHFRRYRTKNDKPRQLPLSAAVIATLPYLRLAAVGGKLFPLKPATVWYMWDNIRDDLKAQGFEMDDVVLHSMRHTKLTRLAKAGVSIHKIMLFAGHSDIKVTVDHYAHLDSSDLAGLAEVT